MKKNKTIFLLGGAFFIFALVKYAFTPDQMPTVFISFEVLSFMVILFMVYYVLNAMETCKHGGSGASMDRECMQRQVEIEKLKKLLALHEENNKTINEADIDSDSVLSQLKQCLTRDTKKTSKDLFAVIKSNFELMAGLVYCTSAEGNLTVLSKFGLDDDWKIEPVVPGEGLHGQAIVDNKAIEVEDIPEDYFDTNSGMGSAKPKYIYLLPLHRENDIVILIEVAVFKQLSIVPVWNQLIAKA